MLLARDSGSGARAERLESRVKSLELEKTVFPGILSGSRLWTLSSPENASRLKPALALVLSVTEQNVLQSGDSVGDD